MSSRSKRALALVAGILLAGLVVFVAWPLLPALKPEPEHVGFFAVDVAHSPWGKPPEGEQSVLASATGLRRWRIPEDIAATIMPVHTAPNQYDEHTYFRYRPNQTTQRPWPRTPKGDWTFHTNSLGLREDAELLAQHPDLRVVVAGDSNSEGMCENQDSFANRLEQLLADARPGTVAECINVSHSGYSFYHYLGSLERFLDTDPDVFVVAFYGGNDFQEVLVLHHYFQGTTLPIAEREYHQRIQAALKLDRILTAQVTMPAIYFETFPTQKEVSLRAAKAVVAEIQSLCTAHCIGLVFVYIPPVTDVRSELLGPLVERLATNVGLDLDELRVNDGLADELLAFLREQSIACLDLRAVFREPNERFYWDREWHIDNAAQELIANALVPLILAAVPKAH